MKINWKKVGKIAVAFGEQLFPILSLVEKFSNLKNLNSQEKQDLAFEALHDELVKGLTPEQLRDPRLEILIRRMINDGVELHNLIAELKS